MNNFIYNNFLWEEKKQFISIKIILDLAVKNSLHICGSVGMKLHQQEKINLKKLNDIDFITTNYYAFNFITDLQESLLKYTNKSTIYINNKTRWVPEEVDGHIRIENKYLVCPICIFYKEEECQRIKYIDPVFIQNLEEIKTSKKKMYPEIEKGKNQKKSLSKRK